MLTTELARSLSGDVGPVDRYGTSRQRLREKSCCCFSEENRHEEPIFADGQTLCGD